MPTAQQIPHRQSLTTNVARLLREQILAGAWRGWLTDERRLCKTLHVSRNTVRTALQQLAQEGLIETVHGRGHRILSTRENRRSAEGATSVGVIVPKLYLGDRQFTSLFMDEVRSLLYDAGIEMQLYSGRQFTKRHSYKALERLIERAPHSCWLLCGGSNNGAQRWFQQRGLPTLISGVKEALVDLPAVSVDNERLGRKGAELILEAGHRRILLVRPGAASDGFAHAIKDFKKSRSDEPVDLSFVQPSEDSEVFHRNLKRALSRPDRPTAIYINESSQYLQTMSFLIEAGIRVPEEVSLVCRDSESYLDYLFPEPTRFQKSPIVYGDLLVERIMKLLHNDLIEPGHTLILPELVQGCSLGPPP
jgi:DNA-binding LacI/PurR family transcriptional regulator